MHFYLREQFFARVKDVSEKNSEESTKNSVTKTEKVSTTQINYVA